MPAFYEWQPRLSALPSAVLAQLEVSALAGTTPLLPALYSLSASVLLEGAHLGDNCELSVALA